jgi:hypothetical protein
MNCGPLLTIWRNGLVTSFMAGLGGDVILLEDFDYMAKVLPRWSRRKRPASMHRIGFEE